MECYPSWRRGQFAKLLVPQGSVGSSPTHSARKFIAHDYSWAIFYYMYLFIFIILLLIIKEKGYK